MVSPSCYILLYKHSHLSYKQQGTSTTKDRSIAKYSLGSRLNVKFWSFGYHIFFNKGNCNFRVKKWFYCYPYICTLILKQIILSYVKNTFEVLESYFDSTGVGPLSTNIAGRIGYNYHKYFIVNQTWYEELRIIWI